MEQDFEIKIEYDESESNPERIFQLIASFLSDLNNVDKMLCDTMPVKVCVKTYLSKVEEGSIKIFLRNQLEKIDDEALEEGNYKIVLGKYLKATKANVMKYLDKKIAEDKNNSLKKLQKDIFNKSREFELENSIKTYKPIPTAVLAKNISALNKTFSSLTVNEKIKFTQDSEEIELGYNPTYSFDNFKEEISENIFTSESKMILKIKKADYLGMSQWEFKDTKGYIIKACITDEEWLKAFQNNTINAQPNDSLDCLVKITTMHAEQGKVIDVSYEITKVNRVVSLINKQLKIKEFE